MAWRDLDDAEAGGSELHAHEILTRWAEAGIDVRLWTSRVDGAARYIHRSGYAVNRRAGRYAVFPRTAVAGFRGGSARATAWSRSGTACRSSRRCGAAARGSSSSTTSTPRCGRWSCPRPWPALGYAIEHRVAPPFYRLQPDRHAVRFGPGRPGPAAPLPAPTGHGGPPGDRLRFSPGEESTPTRWWWRWVGWSRSSGSTGSSRPWWP